MLLKNYRCIFTTPAFPYILYGFMYKDGFYSTAPLDSPRVKKWLSGRNRGKIEDSTANRAKLSAPVNMKNRNIVDYFGISIVFLMAVV